jgi:elongation factor P
MTDLKKGTLFILDGEPCEIVDYNFMRMQQRKPVVQAKIRSLINGKISARTFHPGESYAEAEIEMEEIKFIYTSRGEYWFNNPKDPSKRFSFKENFIGDAAKFLKTNMPVNAYKFDDKIINIKLPIKIDYVVKEAPPAVKGDTARGGSKMAVLENGLEVQVPLFIEQGDIVRLNTDTGDYTERVEKAR